MLQSAEPVSTKRMLVSLIKSIDAYNSLLKDHHRRVTAFAHRLGVEFGLPPRRLAKLVIAASIHDIGAIYVKEREQLMRIDVEDPEPHAINGARILSGIPAFDGIRLLVRYHHVRHDDVERGLVSASEVPEESWFLHLADRVAIYDLNFASEPDPRERVRAEIRSRFGRDFLPELRGAFERAAATEGFWRDADEDEYRELLTFAVDAELDETVGADLESLALLFARIVDNRSHWTHAHSRIVGVLSGRIGGLMGYPPETCAKLRVAGFLHDIGKIAVPAEILEKPLPLDEAERETMESHARFSSLILSGDDELAEIGRWAGNHHERRDRTGYPLMAGGERFEPESDIIAYADVFAALLENRPYRSALSPQEAMDVLKSLSPLKLSQDVFNAIAANFAELVSLLDEDRERDLGFGGERDRGQEPWLSV